MKDKRCSCSLELRIFRFFKKKKKCSQLVSRDQRGKPWTTNTRSCTKRSNATQSGARELQAPSYATRCAEQNTLQGIWPTVDVFAIATYGCLGANAYDLLEPWNEQTKKYGPEIENIPVGLRTTILRATIEATTCCSVCHKDGCTSEERVVMGDMYKKCK